MKNSNKGFSLTELMVSLSVVSILLTLGSPDFSQLLSKTRKDANTAKLVSLLKLARQHAIYEKNTVTACLSADGSHCSKNGSQFYIVFSDKNNNKQADENELINITELHEKDLSFELAVSAGRSYLRFQANGTTSEYGRIKQIHGTTSKDIVISRIGRLRLEKTG